MDSENPFRSPQNSSSVQKEKTISISAMQRTSLRIFSVISVSAFFFSCIFSTFDRTKFLRSDDPFLLGGLIGCSMGVFLLVFHLSQFLAIFHIKPILGYLGGSTLVALFFIGYDCMVHMPEGQGIPTIMGITLSVCSVGVIPLEYIRVSKPIILGACISAILYGIGYLITLFSMHYL